jgi:hypothetical protein
MGALFGHPVRHGPADSIACTDHQHHLPRKLLFSRHALQLGLFESPVFNIERFLLRQPRVLVDGLGAAHHFHRAVVELRRTRASLLSLPQAIIPIPGIRITVGFGSRIAGEPGRLHAS